MDELKVEIVGSQSYVEGVEMGLIEEWDWTCQKDCLSLGLTQVANVG